MVVAHRLSTIQNADVIYVLQDGELAESGSHAELMEKTGLYHQLVTLQQIAGKDEEADTSGERQRVGGTGRESRREERGEEREGWREREDRTVSSVGDSPADRWQG